MLLLASMIIGSLWAVGNDLVVTNSSLSIPVVTLVGGLNLPLIVIIVANIFNIINCSALNTDCCIRFFKHTSLFYL